MPYVLLLFRVNIFYCSYLITPHVRASRIKYNKCAFESARLQKFAGKSFSTNWAKKFDQFSWKQNKKCRFFFLSHLVAHTPLIRCSWSTSCHSYFLNDKRVLYSNCFYFIFSSHYIRWAWPLFIIWLTEENRKRTEREMALYNVYVRWKKETWYTYILHEYQELISWCIHW